jgi:hypothetical protein
VAEPHVMVCRDLARGEPARRRDGSDARIVVDEHELDARAQPGGAHRALQRTRRGIVAGARDHEHAVGLAQAPLRPGRPRVVRLEHDMAVRALARGEPGDDRRVRCIAIVAWAAPVRRNAWSTAARERCATVGSPPSAAASARENSRNAADGPAGTTASMTGALPLAGRCDA